MYTFATESTRRSSSLFSRARVPVVLAGALSLAAVGVITAVVVKRGGTAETTIPAGTSLVAALENTVTTEGGQVGRPIELETVEPVTLGNGKTIPEGVVIRGEVTHTKGGGRIAGGPELTLRFTHMEVDGRDYRIEADPFRLKGKGDAAESAAEIGGGAVAGGVVGAIAGDVVKGAVIGAVLGTGVAVVTKGNQIVLPAGQKLRIRLADDVTVRYNEG